MSGTMSNVMNFFNFLKPKRQKPPTIQERVNWLVKPYINILQDLLLWKNPRLSIAFIFGVNLLLWVMRVCRIRPLAVIAMLLLFAVILDAIATVLGANRHSSRERVAKSLKQSSDQFNQLVVKAQQWLVATYSDMMQLRETDHTKFCTITCGSLGLLYVIGKMAGSLLMHIIITIVLLLPLGSNLKSILSEQSQTNDSDAEVEEFLPVLSQTAIEELHRAGEIVPETSEPTSLILPELSLTNDTEAALSYAAGEIESSDEDDDDREDLSVQNRQSNPSPSLPSTDSSDSDEFIIQEPEKILMAERLRAPKSEKKDEAPNKGTTTWFSILKSPFSGATQTADSDSDEFELIDKNDL